jgi:hypothetical protein
MLEVLCDHLAEKPGLYIGEMAVSLWDEFNTLTPAPSTERTHSHQDLQSSVKEEEQYLHQWAQMEQHLRHNDQAELILTQCDKMIESLQALIQNFSLPIAEGAFYDSYDN